MASVTRETRRPYPGRSWVRPAGWSLDWLGVLPFFLYITLFLLVPAFWLVVGAFQTDNGSWTGAQINQLFQPRFEDAFANSIKLSVVTALSGGVLGLLVAYSAVREGSPRWVRSVL